MKRGVGVYSAIDIAKYIIWFCKDKGYSISNLKLQKLLYFVQAQFLVNEGKPAFQENIEAWDFGPVVPEVYQYFKIWGNSEIPSIGIKGSKNSIYQRDRKLIDNILKKCAPYTAAALVEITHSQRPWKDAYEKYCNNIITNESIREYFL